MKKEKMQLLSTCYHHPFTYNTVVTTKIKLVLFSLLLMKPMKSFILIPSPNTFIANHRRRSNLFSSSSLSSSSLSLSPSTIKIYDDIVTSNDKTINISKKEDDNNNDNIAYKKVGMYIHIPYCRQRCKYCNFSIIPIGKSATISTTIQNNTNTNKQLNGFLEMDKQYISSVIKEIELLHNSTSENNNNNNTTIMISSIYIGGGTPSLAPISSIKQIIQTIKETFTIDANIEITMEMDPGTFNSKQLCAYKNTIGINRISLGVQSLNNTILSYVGRTHTYNDIISSLRIIQQVYKDEQNISIDLICGLPGISIIEWEYMLDYVIKYIKPNHISIYDLQLEYGTIFGNWYLSKQKQQNDDNDHIISSLNNTTNTNNKNHYKLPTIDESIQMYKYASSKLYNNAYEHYEISSYALKTNYSNSSYRSNHNELYWTINGEWYSIGLSSTSSIDNYRFTRPNTYSDYINWVYNQTQTPNAKLDFIRPISAQLDDDNEEYLYDIIMTRLRTIDGLDLNIIQKLYGDDIINCILSSIDQYIVQPNNNDDDDDDDDDELITMLKNDHDWILKLTDPSGFLVSNSILSIIFMGLDEYFLYKKKID